MKKMKEAIVHFEKFLLETFYWLVHKINGRTYVIIRLPMVGLGNRLFDIANVYSVVGKRNLTLFWGLDGWVDVPFDDLFEMTDAPGFKIASRRCSCLRHWVNEPECPGRGSDFWHLWTPDALWPQDQLFMRYNTTPEWAIRLYTPFFEQLKPSQQVRSRIEELNLPICDIVCVMIRNSSRSEDKAYSTNLEKFFEVMRRYEKNKKFFLSCMNAEVSKQVHDAFSGRVFELKRKNYRSMVDAVADMYLLGRGSDLICQNGSTFAECAWWWGGCRAKVTKLTCDNKPVF